MGVDVPLLTWGFDTLAWGTPELRAGDCWLGGGRRGGQLAGATSSIIDEKLFVVINARRCGGAIEHRVLAMRTRARASK